MRRFLDEVPSHAACGHLDEAASIAAATIPKREPWISTVLDPSPERVNPEPPAR